MTESRRGFLGKLLAAPLAVGAAQAAVTPAAPIAPAVRYEPHPYEQIQGKTWVAGESTLDYDVCCSLGPVTAEERREYKAREHISATLSAVDAEDLARGWPHNDRWGA